MSEQDNQMEEISRLRKAVDDLKIEEGAVISELYARQKEAEALRYLLAESEQVLSEVIQNNNKMTGDLEKLLESVRVYL